LVGGGSRSQSERGGDVDQHFAEIPAFQHTHENDWRLREPSVISSRSVISSLLMLAGTISRNSYFVKRKFVSRFKLISEFGSSEKFLFTKIRKRAI
jgi:hypothetical protein